MINLKIVSRNKRKALSIEICELTQIQFGVIGQTVLEMNELHCWEWDWENEVGTNEYLQVDTAAKLFMLNTIYVEKKSINNGAAM